MSAMLSCTGFLLNACSAFGIVPAGAGVHAWMGGAAGVMTLAVMSRASSATQVNN